MQRNNNSGMRGEIRAFFFAATASLPSYTTILLIFLTKFA